MMIDAKNLHFRALNERINEAADEQVVVRNCCGQRYIASGLSGKRLELYGTPGNALGAYLDGSTILLHGNAQEAVGDTMNAGEIDIDGMAGDATGYAMRGGSIFIHGNVGYRAGIHMKEYQDKKPLLVVGGAAGSFLGEYQAGGTIIVLGLHAAERVPVGNFCGTGMHGGVIYLRAESLPVDFSERLLSKKAEQADLEAIMPALRRFCSLFHEDLEAITARNFYVIRPNTNNPYKQLYAAES